MAHLREAVVMEREIVSWLQERAASSGMVGGIVGLSGGIDSAVVAALLRRAFGDAMLALILPCHSASQDETDALAVADALGLPLARVDLTEPFDRLAEALAGGNDGPLSPLALANVKPRLRMIALYALARDRRFLVCGTGNRDELTVGYFTKHGDSGVDLLPLGDLVKGEVRLLAAHLGVPRAVIDKPPTAGLWPGQTDEGEMGVTYADLDTYLLTGHGPDAVRDFVDRAQRQSEHKRALPPICSVSVPRG